MARNTKSVGPKSEGGWQVSGESRNFKTQADAVKAARSDLLKSGGGELQIKGRDGKVRAQSTIGRDDPRTTKG